MQKKENYFSLPGHWPAENSILVFDLYEVVNKW